MVRSRSEASLNKIFLDLCISPEVRSKNPHIRNNHHHHYQRKPYRSLPALQPMKSNSCSDLNKTSEDTSPSTSIDTSESDTLDLTVPFQLSPLIRKGASQIQPIVINPLVPCESTGFLVQPPTPTLISSSPKTATQFLFCSNHAFRFHNSTYHEKSTITLPLTPLPSVDRKQQDYTSRLRDRLKSRNHLRNHFLS